MTAHNFIDLTGKQFGYWTVIRQDFNYCKEHNIKVPKPYWVCECKCGKIKSVCGDNLRNGKSQSCGCYKKELQSKELIEELLGKHINNFTVIEVDKDFYKNKTYAAYKTAFKCRCDCGNTFSTIGETIRQNRVHRCSECNKKRIGEMSFKNLTGQTFGLLYVEKFLRMIDSRALYLCKCKCGRYKEVLGKELTNGHVKSCGCLRSVGENKIKIILEENNIPFEEQKTFSNCYINNKANKSKFDFYINNSFLLEFDGIQHYKSTSGWNDEESFQKTKERDEYKNQWCRENNIPLKRIPYWKLNNITIENIMDNTFLIT